MIVIAFIDSRNGVAFNHRRQSQDREALQKIIGMTAGSVLWVNAYTAQLFAGYDAPQVQEDEHFLDKAGPGEFCLVEGADILPFSFFIEEIILFNWNRAYPADRHFPIDIHNGKWRCVSQEVFTGSSHEKIIMEVYRK